MKIYTGGGDQGKTSLFSGERVAKSHERIEAYGDVDELNSLLGTIAAALPQEHKDLVEEIYGIQADLFHVGAWLATLPESRLTKHLQKITPEFHETLEKSIDQMESELPKLKKFILPGGHFAASMAHVARTVCRRSERHVIRLVNGMDENLASEQLNEILVYLNRLSDYLFVFARYCNKRLNVSDIMWER